MPAKKSFATPRATARNWAMTYGLVRVELSLTKLFKDSERMESNNLCPEHKTPLKQGPMVCSGGPRKHTVKAPIKGFQYEKEHWAILTEEERAALPAEHDGIIDVQAAIPTTMLDPSMYEGTYLAWPTHQAATKPFTMLERYAIEKAVAFVGVGTWWGTTRAIVLRHDYLRGAMILSTCSFASLERKEDAELVKQIPRPKITEEEWKQAEIVFGALPEYFDFNKVTDTVADRQRAIVAAKVKTGKVAIPDPLPVKEVPDLDEALRRMVEEIQAVTV